MSERPKIDAGKAKEIQKVKEEREIILKEIKSRGPLTVDELSTFINMEKSSLLRHLIAMMCFGKVAIVGRSENEWLYDLRERK